MRTRVTPELAAANDGDLGSGKRFDARSVVQANHERYGRGKTGIDKGNEDGRMGIRC
jgi:hypothetical protein